MTAARPNTECGRWHSVRNANLEIVLTREPFGRHPHRHVQFGGRNLSDLATLLADGTAP